MTEEEQKNPSVVQWRLSHIENQLKILTDKFDALLLVVTSAQGSMKVVSVLAVATGSVLGALVSFVIQRVVK